MRTERIRRRSSGSKGLTRYRGAGLDGLHGVADLAEGGDHDHGRADALRRTHASNCWPSMPGILRSSTTASKGSWGASRSPPRRPSAAVSASMPSARERRGSSRGCSARRRRSAPSCRGLPRGSAGQRARQPPPGRSRAGSRRLRRRAKRRLMARPMPGAPALGREEGIEERFRRPRGARPGPDRARRRDPAVGGRLTSSRHPAPAPAFQRVAHEVLDDRAQPLGIDQGAPTGCPAAAGRGRAGRARAHLAGHIDEVHVGGHGLTAGSLR